VKLSFGTDAGVCPYDRSVRQFAFMVKYGMTPMQAIQSATTSAADLLGHSDILGDIKPGKFADVIAVSGDSTAGHQCAGACPVRDERWESLQAVNPGCVGRTL